jgi:hypothetical protein
MYYKYNPLNIIKLQVQVDLQLHFVGLIVDGVANL